MLGIQGNSVRMLQDSFRSPDGPPRRDVSIIGDAPYSNKVLVDPFRSLCIIMLFMCSPFQPEPDTSPLPPGTAGLPQGLRLSDALQLAIA